MKNILEYAVKKLFAGVKTNRSCEIKKKGQFEEEKDEREIVECMKNTRQTFRWLKNCSICAIIECAMWMHASFPKSWPLPSDKFFGSPLSGIGETLNMSSGAKKSISKNTLYSLRLSTCTTISRRLPWIEALVLL